MDVAVWQLQAYQVELEAEVNQLKEENLKLRKQQVSMKKSDRGLLWVAHFTVYSFGVSSLHLFCKRSGM